MIYCEDGQDYERAQALIDHIEQSILKVYRWCFENCEYPGTEAGDCPTWVFYRMRQTYEEISELQEIVRGWEE